MKRVLKNKATQLIGYAEEAEISALFELLGMAAKAGGIVSKSQIQELERFIQSQLSSFQRDHAIAAFRKGKEVPVNRGTITTRAFKLYSLDDKQWLDPIQILDILLKVSLIDGKFNDAKEYVIDCTRTTLAVHKRSYWILRDTLAEKMGITIKREGVSFAAENLDQFKKSDKKFKSSEESKAEPKVKSSKLTRVEALIILKLDESADAQKIKSAHRALVKRYHPDFAGSKKTSDKELKQSIMRFCQIQEAYEFLMAN